VRRGLFVLAVVTALAGRAVAAGGPDPDTALRAVAADQARGKDLASQEQTLSARYQQELAAIDDLKRQRASWRRDRQLKAALADSLETAKQLQATADAIDATGAKLTADRQAAIAAIDAELAGQATDARKAQLTKARAEQAAALDAARPKKIVVPDDTLDPLADPEELEQQAAALRQSEQDLEREAQSLAQQAERFARQAELLAQQRRADELASRDDAGPRRTPGGAGRSDGAAPQTGNGPGSGGTGAPVDSLSSPPAYEGQPDFVLADVIDAAAIDALRKAGRGSDPGAKAAAANAARDQVEARLRRLRERRAAIEARARELRK
jgi:hypothetical protein